MRSRRHLVLASAVALLLAVAPSIAGAAMPVGVAPGVPSVTSSQHPFIAPQSRPSEERQRPTDDNDPNRNAYTVPEAPRSPACSQHFCVHWVAKGLDAPNLADGDADGLPDYVES
ncbi:MAG TPA: hypothetical protein VK889_04195, partial [Solirubrobacterales bacterium]|nr:hypothetical protein [Solirubrobacterales bacterium]